MNTDNQIIQLVPIIAGFLDPVQEGPRIIELLQFCLDNDQVSKALDIKNIIETKYREVHYQYFHDLQQRHVVLGAYSQLVQECYRLLREHGLRRRTTHHNP